ncbi:MAG: apolipoprotein N-acyltransferase [Chthoniobacterales bacterium]
MSENFKNKNLKALWPYLASVLSGVLLGCSFAPFGWTWSIWVGIIPLILAVYCGRPSGSSGSGAWYYLSLGYLTGFIYFLICFFWIHNVTLPGYIALCAYLAIYPALWTLFVGLCCRAKSAFSKNPIGSPWASSRHNLILAALLAGAWVATEWLRGVVFTGFGWDALGIALYNNILLIQIADITGVGGVSFLIAFTNAVGAFTLIRFREEIRAGRLRIHWDFGFAIALIGLVFVYGVKRVSDVPKENLRTIRIGAVQPNIPQYQKWNKEFQESIENTYAQLTEYAASMKPDLLLWPEAATSRPVTSNEETWNFVQELREKWEGDFLLGSVLFTEEGDFNSALLFNEEGVDFQTYHKMHLVPFGEFVPFRYSFPVFAWIIGDLVPEDFDRGAKYSVLKMDRKDGRIAALICFEDTLGDLARHFVLEGANFFATITNDGWFLESAGSFQHTTHAVFRCVENKIPMVRAANTGITCIIDSYGRITERLSSESGNTFIEGVLVDEITIQENPVRTIYTRVGELFSILCLLFILLVAMVTSVFGYRKRMRTEAVSNGTFTK